MVATVVSPSSAGSPATEMSPPASPPLFDAVHSQSHVASDWMHYYDIPDGEEEDIYLLLEELAREQSSGRTSENECPKWTVESSGKDVAVTFGELRERVWKIT